MIAPIIFVTIVTRIAGMQDTKKVGRVGIKAILYFEVVSILALIIGLIIVNLFQPGAGMHVYLTLDQSAVAKFVKPAQSHGVVDFFMNIIPESRPTGIDGEAGKDRLFALRGRVDSSNWLFI